MYTDRRPSCFASTACAGQRSSSGGGGRSGGSRWGRRHSARRGSPWAAARRSGEPGVRVRDGLITANGPPGARFRIGSSIRRSRSCAGRSPPPAGRRSRRRSRWPHRCVGLERRRLCRSSRRRSDTRRCTSRPEAVLVSTERIASTIARGAGSAGALKREVGGDQHVGHAAAGSRLARMRACRRPRSRRRAHPRRSRPRPPATARRRRAR